MQEATAHDADDHPRHDAPTLVVCVVTYERAAFLRRCLASLQTSPGISQIVIVDASAEPDPDSTSGVTIPVKYVHAPQLAGWMTKSRNEGLRWATGEVIAFIDDDVKVTTGWAMALRHHFDDTDLAAACGRTRNGITGEDRYDLPIGRILDDGTLTDGFASEAEGPVEIDHGIGANMSFRASVLGQLDGFRDDYPGTAIREDTDIFLRVGALGGRIKFLPDAVVDHLPAPHVVGERFDLRYKLYARRNHLVLLGRNFGIGDPRVRRWLARQASDVIHAGGPRRTVERAASVVVGCAWGGAALFNAAGWRALDPTRRTR